MALGSSRSILIIACLALSTGSVLTKGYDQRGHHRDRDRLHRRDWDEDRRSARERDDDDDDQGRRDHDYHGPSRRPPGWQRGRKTGWGNCDVPPGLAKKESCGQTSRTPLSVPHRASHVTSPPARATRPAPHASRVRSSPRHPGTTAATAHKRTSAAIDTRPLQVDRRSQADTRLDGEDHSLRQQ